MLTGSDGLRMKVAKRQQTVTNRIETVLAMHDYALEYNTLVTKISAKQYS